MKIAQANIQLTSQRNYVEQNTQQRSLKVWVGNQRPNFEKQTPQIANRTDWVTFSRQAQAKPAAQNSATTEANSEDAVINDPHVFLIKRMIESITGETIHLTPVNLTVAANNAETPVTPSQTAPQGAGFGVEYDSHTYHYEAETTAVTAQGSVQTQDGQTVDFALNLAMQREYVQQTNSSVRLGDAKKVDPLVLNFDGNAVQLTDTKVSFDLNADGKDEQIAFVNANSGFLALDKNNDSKINNGSELFGTQTGNGFAELAAYDSDHNQWIDENDAIYRQLLVWNKNAQGQDQLSHLADRNVGAIYLGQIDSAFAIKDQQNQLLGQVRSSSVYLQENGNAKAIQQIDLAV